MLPVPLNSSKITSSIFEPVSMSAVAMIVSEPPSSMLRAAPKNRFGGYSAVESTPPDMMRPDAGAARLYARARRVMPSSTITTSWPISTSRFARSIVSSATWRVLVGGAVERARHHFALQHVATHVGDFLGPLVDEQHHEVHLGVVAFDREHDLLEDRGLAGLRRRHDEAALALADRREQVDDPAGDLLRVVGQLEAQLASRGTAA